MCWDASEQLADCLSSDAKLRYVLLRVPNDSRQPCICMAVFLRKKRNHSAKIILSTDTRKEVNHEQKIIVI